MILCFRYQSELQWCYKNPDKYDEFYDANYRLIFEYFFQLKPLVHLLKSYIYLRLIEICIIIFLSVQILIFDPTKLDTYYNLQIFELGIKFEKFIMMFIFLNLAIDN
jgi:hypothetical protein